MVPGYRSHRSSMRSPSIAVPEITIPNMLLILQVDSFFSSGSLLRLTARRPAHSPVACSAPSLAGGCGHCDDRDDPVEALVDDLVEDLAWYGRATPSRRF